MNSDGGVLITDDRVHARLELPCRQLDVRPPPADCHLRALDVRGVWVVYLWSAEGDREDLVAWMREHGEFDVRDAQAENRVLALETDELPPAWHQLFELFDVQTVVFRRSGEALISIQGSRNEVALLQEALGDETDLEHVTEASKAPGMMAEDPLTETERDAVLAAYKAGYFEVPRGVRLDDLAEDLDKSSGALSTLLRRGLERLVASYARDKLEGPAFPVGSQADTDTEAQGEPAPSEPREAPEKP